MLGKKKKKDIQVVGKEEGDRQKNINQPKFKIVIFKTLGQDVYQELLSFYADQEKDSSGSMFLVNKENNFKESLAINKNEEIMKLKDRLDIRGLSVEEQVKAISKKIESQEDRIRNIERGVYIDKEAPKAKAGSKGESDEPVEEIGEKVNTIEENKFLKQLKVLKYVVVHSEAGSYDTIDGNGFRQRYYLYDEGALVPMFWDRKIASLYTAVDTRIKFYKADQDLINADYIDENKDKWASIGRGLFLIVLAVLTIASMVMFVKNLDRSNDLDNRALLMATAIEESNMIQCMSTVVTNNEALLEILDDYIAENNESNINLVTTDLT